MAGRPKSDDPTVPVMFRMKRSKWEWWVAEAHRRGIPKPQHLIAQVLEHQAVTEQ